MNICSFISYFFATSLVNFNLCSNSRTYHFASEYHCREYQINSTVRSVQHEMDFDMEAYSFKIALVQENINESCWVYVEIKRHRNDYFQINVGASKNPNLNWGYYSTYSNDLIGSFEKVEPDCTLWDSFSSSSSSSLRVKWIPPEERFTGQIYLYVALYEFSFKKSLFIKYQQSDNMESQKTKASKNDNEVAFGKPKSNLVELINSTDSSSITSIFVAVIAIGIQVCFLVYLCKTCKNKKYCCKTENEVSLCQCFSVDDDDGHQMGNIEHHTDAVTSTNDNMERNISDNNARDLRQEQPTERGYVSCDTSLSQEHDLPPSYEELFGKF